MLRTTIADTIVSERGQWMQGFARLPYLARTPKGHGTAELANLYVRRIHQRGGVGRALIGAAMDRARAGGHTSMFLTVHYANRSAIAFYKAFGFAAVDETIFAFDGGEVRNLVYARRL